MLIFEYLPEHNKVLAKRPITTIQIQDDCYCQNPNLTTTQPQPNLNLVGFDTIITFHTTPQPPTTTPPELYFYHK